MPFVVPALVVGGGAALFAAEGLALAAFLQAFSTTFVLGAASYALQRKPKGPDTDQAVPLVTVRQPIPAWQVVIGQARVAGVMTFRYISPDRRFWHMVITLACHRSHAIDEIWFNDERVPVQSDGRVMGKYAKTVTVAAVSQGTVPGTPFQVTLGGTIGAVESVQLNFARGFTSLRDVSPANPANPQEYKRSGQTFTFHAGAAGKPYKILWHSLEPTGESWARVKMSLGDEAVGVQPFPDLVSESGGAWSNDHRQYGHTKLYVRLESAPEIFPTGVPNITVIMRGALLFDPRTGLTEYSNNAALAINHYLTNTEYGLGATYASEIDEADLIAAANSADDTITLNEGGTEKRYTANGSFLVSEQPKQVLDRLLAACAGTLVNEGDRWHIGVGVYYAPTVTLAEGDLVGQTQVVPFTPSRDGGNANGVKGVFTNPNGKWQSDDFPAFSSSTYLTQDGGERKWDDIDLTGFVTSIMQAQRLAKIHLFRLRQGLVESGPFSIAAWQVVPGRTVARTDAHLGFSAKAFEVVESRLALASVGEGLALQTDLSLRETSAAVFDWLASEEQLEDSTANTTLPDAGVIGAPGAPSVSEELYETRDGRGVAAKIIVSFTQSSYAYRPKYQLEYKKSAASTWIVLPLLEVSTGSTAAVVQEILDAEPGTYDFRVLAIGFNGSRSAYATTLAQEVVGLGAAPSAPTGVSLQVAGGAAYITLTQHPDLDVRRGGRILVRHTEDVASQTWESSFSIGMQESWPGDAVLIVLPLKAGTYLLKAQDSTGQESASFASVITKQASVLTFITLATTIQQDPTFGGTHSNTVTASSVLKLDTSGGAVLPSGTYTFSAGFDFGSVQKGRITGRLEGVIVNVNDTIDARTDNIDSWVDFDGNSGIGSLADAWLETRTTDDDPAGSPTWSAWGRLDAAEYNCRGMQFRVQIRSFDPTINFEIDVCRVKAEKL